MSRYRPGVNTDPTRINARMCYDCISVSLSGKISYCLMQEDSPTGSACHRCAGIAIACRPIPDGLWEEVSDVCEFLVDVLRATIAGEVGDLDWSEFRVRVADVSAVAKDWKGRVPTRAEARGARVAAGSVPTSSQAAPASSPVQAPAPGQFTVSEVDSIRFLLGSVTDARLGHLEARLARVESQLVALESKSTRVRADPAPASSGSSGSLAAKFNKSAGSSAAAGGTRSTRKRAGSDAPSSSKAAKAPKEGGEGGEGAGAA